MWLYWRVYLAEVKMGAAKHLNFLFYILLFISYSFLKSFSSNLVYVRVVPRVCQDVKACVNIIEQVDYLDGSFSWGVLAAEGIESYDAAKEDGHIVVALCRDGPFVPQLIGNRRRQNRIEQSVRIGRNEHFEFWCTRAAGLKSVAWISILFAHPPPFGHFAMQAALTWEGGVFLW